MTYRYSQITGSSLVQIMAWHRKGAKPLSESMLNHHQKPINDAQPQLVAVEVLWFTTMIAFHLPFVRSSSFLVSFRQRWTDPSAAGVPVPNGAKPLADAMLITKSDIFSHYTFVHWSFRIRFSWQNDGMHNFRQDPTKYHSIFKVTQTANRSVKLTATPHIWWYRHCMETLITDPL